MNKVLSIFLSLVSLICSAHSEDEKVVLGTLYCGTEYGPGITYGMTIRKEAGKENIYDIIWTLPWNDKSYEYTGKFKVKELTKDSVIFIRDDFGEYKASIDSNGNFINGTWRNFKNPERNGPTPGIWELIKVKTSPDCVIDLKPDESPAVRRRVIPIPLKQQGPIKQTTDISPEAADISPVAVWTFEKDENNTAGDIKGELFGSAKIADGKLIVDGNKSYLKTSELTFPLSEKTVLVRCINKNKDQSSVGVVAVTGFNGVPNDVIGYGTTEPRRWGPGSEWAFRSSRLKAPEETASESEIVEIAATYSKNGEIAFYRNGLPYGKIYYPDSPTQDYRSNRYRLLIGSGINHLLPGPAGFFNGEIDLVMIFNRALNAGEIYKQYKKNQSSTNPQQNP
jgi:hypothetical protein